MLDKILERSGIPKDEIQNFKTVTGLTSPSDIYEESSITEIPNALKGIHIKSRYIFYNLPQAIIEKYESPNDDGEVHNLKFSLKRSGEGIFQEGNKEIVVDGDSFSQILDLIKRGRSTLIKPSDIIVY